MMMIIIWVFKEKPELNERGDIFSRYSGIIDRHREEKSPYAMQFSKLKCVIRRSRSVYIFPYLGVREFVRKKKL